MDSAGDEVAKTKGAMSDEGSVLFETLTAAAVDGIIVIDSKGSIRLYNAACQRLFGYSPDEVVGHNVNILMPSPYRDEHDGYLAHYRATGEKRIIGIGRKVVGRRKDGTTFPMYLSVGEGVIAGESIFVGIIHDETAQDAAETRLREIQSELFHVARLSSMGQMAAMLAHELNQPLTAIANYLNASQRLIDKGLEGGKAKLLEALQRGSDQAIRAGQIIQRMRGFVGRGGNEQLRETLPPLIEDSIALAVPAQRGIEIKCAYQPNLPMVLIDKVQIQQVLLNLLRNAAEAMDGREQQELEVTARAVGGMVQVSISDTGPGLAPEVAAQLFQPFISTKRDGMGMGLSVCRSIIEDHGGQLWSEDRTGRGATFLFTVAPAPLEESCSDA